MAQWRCSYVLLLACCVLLFLGADQCTQEQNISAAITSSAASSIACFVGRIFFRWGLNTGARKRALLANERNRLFGYTEHMKQVRIDGSSQVA
jgi:hypothetical protein